MNWSDLKFRLQHRCKQLQLGWRYATGALTREDAQSLTVRLQSVTGWHDIVILDTNDVVSQALETYEDHLQLEELCEAAASRVARKYDFSDEWNLALRFALEEVEEHARSWGVTLVRKDDDAVMQVASAYVDDDGDPD